MENYCRVCGCTELQACPGGCRWISDEQDLCDACVQKLISVDQASGEIQIDTSLGTLPPHLIERIQENIVQAPGGTLIIVWCAVWDEFFNLEASGGEASPW